MNVILFDTPANWKNLLPLTFTRPISNLRVGILTIADKWEHDLGLKVGFSTEKYLRTVYPLQTGMDNLMINASLLPDSQLVEHIQKLKPGEAVTKKDEVLAYRAGFDETYKFLAEDSAPERVHNISFDVKRINYPWDIFQNNGAEITKDFMRLTQNRKSIPLIDPHTKVYHPENVFIEEGAVVKASILNAEGGPIYIGKNTEIQEGSLVRGPFALCEGSVLNMGAKMRGDTTIGPYSKIGGEVSNSVILGYSNKAHDGFLGNSVLGEWCNLGADTNTSNLKNNYAPVKVWNYLKEQPINTGLQFCGLIMGDHSKSGINTMFNTGTVVGISANIFGGGFPPTFVPSFSWGGAETGLSEYRFDKAIEVAKVVMQRRNKQLTEEGQKVMKHIYEQSSRLRKFFSI